MSLIVGNSSGGAGFTLGAAQNIFTGADRAAAEAERDAYAADPANSFLVITLQQ